MSYYCSTCHGNGYTRDAEDQGDGDTTALCGECHGDSVTDTDLDALNFQPADGWDTAGDEEAMKEKKVRLFRLIPGSELETTPVPYVGAHPVDWYTLAAPTAGFQEIGGDVLEAFANLCRECPEEKAGTLLERAIEAAT